MGRTNIKVDRENKMVPFSDLKYGEYFYTNGALWVYLDNFSFTDDDDTKGVFNAFSFDDSTVDFFPGDTMVRLVRSVDITFSM